MKDPRPDAKRINEVIGIMAEAINKVANAKSQEEATKAVATMLARIPDIMNIPAYQQAMAYGIAMGIKDSAQDEKAMTATELILLRKQAKMSQAELAEAIGVVQSRISTWENDREPVPLQHVDAIRRVCSKDSPNDVTDA